MIILKTWLILKKKHKIYVMKHEFKIEKKLIICTKRFFKRSLF